MTHRQADLADFLVEQQQLKALLEADFPLQPQLLEVSPAVLQQLEQVLDAVAGGRGRVSVLYVGVHAHLAYALQQQLAFLQSRHRRLEDRCDRPPTTSVHTNGRERPHRRCCHLPNTVENIHRKPGIPYILQ